MRVSAKADYAVRACAELASSPHGDPVRADDLAVGQQLPVAFLERILGDLRRGGVVASIRGRSGGYRLARPADEITLADVIRDVLDEVTLAGRVSGELPPTVHELAARHDAWVNPPAGAR